MIKLRDLLSFLFESQEDDMVRLARSANGLIDPKGNIHIVPSLEHVDYLVKQPKFKIFKNRLAHANGDEWAQIYEIVMSEAMRDGWVRVSGRPGELGFTALKETLRKRSRFIEDIVMFAEAILKRPVRVYKSEFIIRKPQKQNYNKDFGND